MIMNQTRGVANVTTCNPICPRCGHPVIFHVMGKDDIVNPNQSKATLTGCFIMGCTMCPNYTGDA